MTTPWPLSAPATALLRSPRTSRGELLRLGIRELVLVGAWRLQADPLPRRRFGWQRAQTVRLFPRERQRPEALARLDTALRSSYPSAKSSAARHVVEAALKQYRQLSQGVQDAARGELATLGLVDERPRPFGLGTRRDLTSTGRAWQASLGSTLTAWSRGLQQGGPAAQAVLRAASASPGLLLAADPSLLAELDRELRRVRPAQADGGEGAAVVSADSDPSTGGLGELELHGLLDAVGDLLDGLRGLGDLDFGISDGGGSGDGGDGGGGGD